MVAELSFILSSFVAVFVIVDPFAVIPVYLSLTERFDTNDRKRIRLKACLVALGILAVFGLTGMAVFDLFGITIPAFQIAGGILLLLLGIAQLNAKRNRGAGVQRVEMEEKEDVSIFPLATPLLAGPGAISTVVLAASQVDSKLRHFELVFSIFAALACCYIVLIGAPLLYRVLKQTGLNLLTRIMGIILTAIAVQYMLNGIKGALIFMRVIH